MDGERWGNGERMGLHTGEREMEECLDVNDDDLDQLMLRNALERLRVRGLTVDEVMRTLGPLGDGPLSPECREPQVAFGGRRPDWGRRGDCATGTLPHLGACVASGSDRGKGRV